MAAANSALQALDADLVIRWVANRRKVCNRAPTSRPSGDSGFKLNISNREMDMMMAVEGEGSSASESSLLVILM